jgi:hypothetical protein
MWEWRHSSIILDLDARWKSVVRFTLQPLYPQGKNPSYPLCRRLSGPQSLSELYGGKKILNPDECMDK